jgi:hypothetical protein
VDEWRHPGLRSATRPGCHIGLGGRVPAGPAWAGASERGCEGGLLERKRGSGPKGDNWPKRFRGKKSFLFSKPFVNFKLIRFQSKFEFQMILVATENLIAHINTK